MRRQLLPLILDESCAQLESRVLRLAEPRVFRRKNGYLDDPERCAGELDEFRGIQFGARPVIVVAASFGALTAMRYAYGRPEAVCGLVLLDPSHPRQAERALAILSSAGAATSPVAAPFRKNAGESAPAWWRAGCASIARVQALGELPMIVLAAGRPAVDGPLDEKLYLRLVEDRQAQLGEYARLSTCGVLRVIDGAGHAIAEERPAAVVRAIGELRQTLVARTAPQ